MRSTTSLAAIALGLALVGPVGKASEPRAPERSGIRWTHPVVVSGQGNDTKAYSPAAWPRPGGGIYAAWVQRYTAGPPSATDIVFREFDGTRWMEPVNVSHDLMGGSLPVVVCDDRGTVYVAWLLKYPRAVAGGEQGRYPEIVFVAREGGRWTRPKRVRLSALGVGIGPVVRPYVGVDGRARLLWMDTSVPTSLECVLSVQPPIGPVARNLGTLPRGAMADVTRDAAGQLHLTIVHSLAAMGEPAVESPGIDNDVFYSRMKAGESGWGPLRLVYFSRNSACYYPRISVSRDGAIHIVWLEDYDQDLFAEGLTHAWSQHGGAWSAPTVVARFDSGVCLYASTACDPAGRLHVAWTYTTSFARGSRTVYYAVWDSSTGWSSPEPLFPNSLSPQLVVDDRGVLHLLWAGSASGRSEERQVFHCTAVLEYGASPPRGFELSSVTPNPFANVTTLTYRVRSATFVEIVLRDIRGRLVRSLYKGPVGPGEHQLKIPGADLPSGVYICTFRGGGVVLARKVVKLNR